jgi:hypothetical protein
VLALVALGAEQDSDVAAIWARWVMEPEPCYRLSANLDDDLRRIHKVVCIFVCVQRSTTRGALSPPHTSRALGLATQGQARDRYSRAALGDLQDKGPIRRNLFRKECQGCNEARKPRCPAPHIQSAETVVTPMDRLTGGYARRRVVCLSHPAYWRPLRLKKNGMLEGRPTKGARSVNPI